MRRLIEKRSFPFLSAALFPASEHCGNALENVEKQMGQTTGLRQYRHP
jgi:hypothetical protein